MKLLHTRAIVQFNYLKSTKGTRPILARNQIGVINAVVDMPKHITMVSTSPPPLGTHIPHRKFRRVDLRDNLRQHVALLPDQHGDDPTQRRAPARPHLRGVPFQGIGDLAEELQPGGADCKYAYTCTFLEYH
jgi:hypothetical protein